MAFKILAWGRVEDTCFEEGSNKDTAEASRGLGEGLSLCEEEATFTANTWPWNSATIVATVAAFSLLIGCRFFFAVPSLHEHIYTFLHSYIFLWNTGCRGESCSSHQ